MRTNVKELLIIAKSISDYKDEFDGVNEEENEEYLSGFFGEAKATNALKFFNIFFDNETDEIEYPDTFDFKRANTILSGYLDKIEQNEAKEENYSEEVNEYDRETAPFRGADDGTFDYAGTYVVLILELLEKHSNSSKKYIDGDEVWENINSNLDLLLEFNNQENSLNWSKEEIEERKQRIIHEIDRIINE